MGVFKCSWKIGDVFAYKIESEMAKEIYGQYFLIQKVDEYVYDSGKTIPIVYVKITNNQRIPDSEEEFHALEFVQMWATPYEERFWPVDGSRPKEDIQEKMKIKYKVDEYGYMPEYRVRLFAKNKKSIPSDLVYVGNYKIIKHPLEFVPHSKFNIEHVDWIFHGDTFESKMIEKYYDYNRRELVIYKDRKNYLPVCDDNSLDFMTKCLLNLKGIEMDDVFKKC